MVVEKAPLLQTGGSAITKERLERVTHFFILLVWRYINHCCLTVMLAGSSVLASTLPEILLRMYEEINEGILGDKITLPAGDDIILYLPVFLEAASRQVLYLLFFCTNIHNDFRAGL